MRKIIYSVWLIFIFLWIPYEVFAVPPNNGQRPKTFLGPTLRLSFNDALTNYAAYSFAGEAGKKNLRLGGSAGWQFTDTQSLKISAEYLWQKISYLFFTDNVDRWMQQGAVGGEYGYYFPEVTLDPKIGLNAYYAKSINQNLGTFSGSYVNNAGTTINYVDTQRIAGSTTESISPFFEIIPWQNLKLTGYLNYDNVSYNRMYAAPSSAIGFGHTIRITQALSENVDLGLSESVRQPYNHYEARLQWNNLAYEGIWSVALEGAYTIGKRTLPTTYNIGLTANYYIEQDPSRCEADRRQVDNMLAWVNRPAVYMPEVIAVSDESLITS